MVQAPSVVPQTSCNLNPIKAVLLLSEVGSPHLGQALRLLVRTTKEIQVLARLMPTRISSSNRMLFLSEEGRIREEIVVEGEEEGVEGEGLLAKQIMLVEETKAFKTRIVRTLLHNRTNQTKTLEM